MRISDWSSDVCSSDLTVYDGFDGDLALTEVQGIPVGSIFSGRYIVGPKIDPATADGFFNQNSDRFEMDTDGTIGDSLAADYRIRERILAAYVMTTVQFGDFTAIPGVRVENTKIGRAHVRTPVTNAHLVCRL